MRVVDLFAGAGGFSTGAVQAGARVLWAANHWPLAVTVHQKNHPFTEHSCQDLQQADWRTVPEMDLLLSSPSCIGHSQVATSVGKGMRGKAPIHDALRSTAWAVVSCVEVRRPKAVLVENVPEFLNWVLYPAWRTAMEALKYRLVENLIEASDFGVPQNRKRLFITAIYKGKGLKLETPKNPEIVGFRSFVDRGASGWEPVKGKPLAVQERVAKGRSNFPKGMFLSHHVTGHGGRSLDRPIWTITTKHQSAIVREGRNGDEMRMLSVPEYRRAMGFPDDYWLPESRTCDSVKLLGNAVCPPVAKGLVKQIMERV